MAAHERKRLCKNIGIGNAHIYVTKGVEIWCSLTRNSVEDFQSAQYCKLISAWDLHKTTTERSIERFWNLTKTDETDFWWRLLIVKIKVWIWGTRPDRYPSQAESNGCRTRPQRKVRMQLKRDKEALVERRKPAFLESSVLGCLPPIQCLLGSLTSLPLDILLFCSLLTFAGPLSWSFQIGEPHSVLGSAT